MEVWRKVWREGVAPVLSTDGLTALAKALAENDHRLIHSKTVMCDYGDCSKVIGACAVGYAGWMGDKLTSVREVESYFVAVCHEINRRLNEPHVGRYFLNWFDDTPREKVRAELLPEVQRELERRQSAAACESSRS